MVEVRVDGSSCDVSVNGKRDVVIAECAVAVLGLYDILLRKNSADAAVFASMIPSAIGMQKTIQNTTYVDTYGIGGKTDEDY